MKVRHSYQNRTIRCDAETIRYVSQGESKMIPYHTIQLRYETIQYFLKLTTDLKIFLCRSKRVKIKLLNLLIQMKRFFSVNIFNIA